METKNNSIIVDSSAVISLISESDSNHQIAQQALNELPEDITALIVPDIVFYEQIDAIGKRHGHAKAVVTAKWLLAQELMVIADTTKLRLEILEMFEGQPEGVSFADCAVMVTAQKYGTNLIFGFDRAFFTNGFTRLGVDDRTDQVA